VTRAARLAPLLVAPLVLLGCATGAPVAAPPPSPTSTAPTTPPPDPVQVCVNQLTYWAGEDLRGDADGSFDYQHRGLSSEQNDALAVLVEQARAQAWTPEQLAERARAACVEVVAGDPTGF
jgi:hypothetical protein